MLRLSFAKNRHQRIKYDGHLVVTHLFHNGSQMDANICQVERLRNHSLSNSSGSGVTIDDAKFVHQLVLPRVPAKLAHSLENVRRKRIVCDYDTRSRPLKLLVEDLLGKSRLSTSWIACDQHRRRVGQTATYELVESFERRRPSLQL